MWIINSVVLILFFFIYNAEAWDVTKVLQNGLNGYNGCFDSYIHKSEDDSSMFTQNFGNDSCLSTADCPT